MCPRFCLVLACVIPVWAAWAESGKVVKYTRPEPVPAADAGQMFRAYCAVCHGVDGRGGGPAADSLRKRPADLTRLTIKNGGKFPSGLVANVIQSYGPGGPHGSREMPMWGTVFRAFGDYDTVRLRVANLTNFVESLQRK